MSASASLSGKRCSWCGTLNSASENACSKCAAALTSAQQPVFVTPAMAEVAPKAPSEEHAFASQPEVGTTYDVLPFDAASGYALRSLEDKFISGRTLALAVAGCLAVYVLGSFAGVVVELSQVALEPKRTIATAAVLTSGDLLTLLIRVSLTGVAMLTAIFFLIWIYRAHKNLRPLGATDLNYSPGWAVGGFFVPLLNIVRPYQVISEIWKASVYRARRSRGAGWVYEPVPIFITAWWGLWLLSGFLEFITATMIFGATAGNETSVSRYRLLSYLANIACAALAAAVVLKINATQDEADRVNAEMDKRLSLNWPGD